MNKPPVWLVEAAKRGVPTAVIAMRSWGKSAARRSASESHGKETEHKIQAAFFDRVLADDALNTLPIYAVPNFLGHVGKLHTRKRVGGRAKAEGRRKGIPDVNVDVACGVGAFAVHGLRFEFKLSRTATPRAEQRDWHQRLRAGGFAVVIVTDADEALSLLRDYLSNGERAQQRSAAQGRHADELNRKRAARASKLASNEP